MSNVLYGNEAIDFIKLNSLPIVYVEFQLCISKLHEEFNKMKGMEKWPHLVSLYLDRLDGISEDTGEEFKVIKCVYTIAPVDQSEPMSEKDVEIASEMMQSWIVYFQINDQNQLTAMVHKSEPEETTKPIH